MKWVGYLRCGAGRPCGPSELPACSHTSSPDHSSRQAAHSTRPASCCRPAHSSYTAAGRPQPPSTQLARRQREWPGIQPLLPLPLPQRKPVSCTITAHTQHTLQVSRAQASQATCKSYQDFFYHFKRYDHYVWLQ